MAGHTGAVVGVEEDDGVVGEPVFLEFGEDASGVLVHGGDAVVEPRPLAADDRGVGVVGG